METDQQIMNLVLVSHEQQGIVEKQLAELQETIAALNLQKAHLEKMASVISKNISSEVSDGASKITYAFSEQLSAFRETYKEYAKEAISKITYTSTKELDERLNIVMASLETAAIRVDKAGEIFEKKSSKITMTLLAKNFIGMIVLFGIGYTMVLWEKREFTNEAAYVNAMRSEILNLEAKISVLEKKGGRIQLRECGPTVCVEVDPATKQVYKNAVIPKGY